MEEFIVKLGIRGVSVEAEAQSPVKRKLKTAKLPFESDRSSECSKKTVTETPKKISNKFQKDKVMSAAAKAVDFIADYQPRKYLLVKPGEKWYSHRVSCSSFQYLSCLIKELFNQIFFMFILSSVSMYLQCIAQQETKLSLG